MVPLYFLPKVTLSGLVHSGRLNQSLIASRGLEAVFGDLSDAAAIGRCEICGQGPDGNPGMVLCAFPPSGEPPRRLGYFPPDQEWTRVREDLWVGIDRVFPPLPAELLRAAPPRHPGHEVLLGDGNRWTVPILFRPESGQPALPRDMYWDEAGAFQTSLRPEYAAVWELSRIAARYFYEPASPDYRAITFEKSLEIALAGLALNYRLGRAEQRVLRLVTTDNAEECLAALVDFQGFLTRIEALDEAEKKSAGRSCLPSSPPGSPADSPITAPPGVTCTSPNEVRS